MAIKVEKNNYGKNMKNKKWQKNKGKGHDNRTYL